MSAFVNSRDDDDAANGLVETVLRYARETIPTGGLQEKVAIAADERRPLRVKMGLDPTTPDLHLGHAVSIRVLKAFQDYGHQPVLIIGDFTAQIGDPSGRNRARPLADADQIRANARTYVNQLARILDISRIDVRYNSEWLDPMTVGRLIRLLSHATLAQVVSRDDFRNRLDTDSAVGLHEIVYPYLQGYDSIAVEADVEIGGVDQLHAFQAARHLQKIEGQRAECAVMMPLLRGLDGTQKMSKSLRNYVGLTDTAEDMFGKLMSIPDDLLDEYLRLASTFTGAEIREMTRALEDGMNPMDIKLQLAANITTAYHDTESADRARDHFDRVHRHKGEPPYESVTVPLVDRLSSLLVATGLATSKSDARRLIQQGAVTVSGERAVDDRPLTQDAIHGLRIRVGKRRLVEVRLQP
jgi:tyrosyl-tRNA synthetase